MKAIVEDLIYVHQTMREDFSGFQHDINFANSMEKHFENLLKKAKKASFNYEHFLILDEYFAGYEDPHVRVSKVPSDLFIDLYKISTGKKTDNIKSNLCDFFSTGVKLKCINNRYFIEEIDQNICRDSGLKINDELIICDGKSIPEIYEQEIEPYLPISVKNSGKFRYAYLVFKRYDKNSNDISVCIFRRGDNTFTKNLSWKLVVHNYFEAGKSQFIYKMQSTSFGKLITLSSLGGYNEKNLKELNQFVSDAVKLRNEQTIILDLRGNGGGRSVYGTDWIKNLYGFSPKWSDTQNAASEIWCSPKNVTHFENFYKYLNRTNKWSSNDKKEWDILIKGVRNNKGKMFTIKTPEENLGTTKKNEVEAQVLWICR